MSNVSEFVKELEAICNKYQLVLVADREGNIGILPSSTTIPIKFNYKVYTWGKEIYVDLEEEK